jgi:hypothetical protein
MAGTATTRAGDTERSRLHANPMRFAAKYRLLDNRVKRPEHDLGPPIPLRPGSEPCPKLHGNYDFNTPRQNNTQAAINAVPPSGVIAPNQRTPLRLNK